MAIIKKNKCYDNRYLCDFKLSLESKGLLTILLIGQPDFDEDSIKLSTYDKDTLEHIDLVLQELVDNNYLTIVEEKYKGQIKYNYIVYHNRCKML